MSASRLVRVSIFWKAWLRSPTSSVVMPVYLRTDAMCSSILAKACVYSFREPMTL